MLDLIFVYGSLLRAARHPMGEKLRAEASLLGAATLPARLYRVSWYPGVVLSDVAGDVVHGEVYCLANPAATLGWLDEYEGITAGPRSVAPLDEYARRPCTVSLVNTTAHTAWVYLFQQDVSGLQRVASGRWGSDG